MRVTGDEFSGVRRVTNGSEYRDDVNFLVASDTSGGQRQEFCSLTTRAGRRASSGRSATVAQVDVGPRQRISSTLRKSGASMLRVASVLNRSASSLFSPSVSGGKSSRWP